MLLFADTDSSFIKKLEDLGSSLSLPYFSAKSGQEVLENIDKNNCSVVVINAKLPDYTGLSILEWAKNLPQSPEIIFIAEKPELTEVVVALKMGAFDYLEKSNLALERLQNTVLQALEKYRLKNGVSTNLSWHPDGFIGSSPKMQEIFKTLKLVAPSNSNILILGESGTGKELVAKALHQYSPRGENPFVAIHCAAMPEALLESELFGYMRGAFTGANTDKQGLFEMADKGTLFLDEIGEVPLNLQVKLLRVLQEGVLRRVGGNKEITIDVRLVAATNRNLEQLMKEGKFREDLFYRLNVISITLPSLRERGDDIGLLANHFLQKFNKQLGTSFRKISPDAMQVLQTYTWPGNVRELENTMERAMILSSGDVLTARSLPSSLLAKAFYETEKVVEEGVDIPYKEAKERALTLFHKTYLSQALEGTNGNIKLASEKVGLDRSNFKKILKKYKVMPKNFSDE